MYPHLLILGTLTVALWFTQMTGAFKCYVCDSKVDLECVENLPKNTRLKPQDCHDIIDAKYCVKTTNIYAGELGTKRFCAANDHGNHCNYIRQPTGDREYRSCIATCSSDACNASVSLHQQPSQNLAISLGLLSLFFRYLVSTRFIP